LTFCRECTEDSGDYCESSGEWRCGPCHEHYMARPEACGEKI
jgi:hypothetical protein